MLSAFGVSALLTRSVEAALSVGWMWKCDLVLFDEEIGGLSSGDFLHQMDAYWPEVTVAVLGSGTTTRLVPGANMAPLILCPADPKLLEAGVEALVSIVRKNRVAEWTVGSLTINSRKTMATIRGQRLALTGMEFRVLEILGLHAGRSVTHEVMMQRVYREANGRKGTIRVFVNSVRRKLAEHDSGLRIKTDYSRGYVLYAE